MKKPSLVFSCLIALASVISSCSHSSPQPVSGVLKFDLNGLTRTYTVDSGLIYDPNGLAQIEAAGYDRSRRDAAFFYGWCTGNCNTPFGGTMTFTYNIDSLVAPTYTSQTTLHQGANGNFNLVVNGNTARADFYVTLYRDAPPYDSISITNGTYTGAYNRK